ncbi:MAG: DUF3868 domain-containing protein [Bacteroidales bacterium]|jgi:hypothetical protein|nr:DUF3868 domain-containing protein [Bacteroidales bacterium]
MKRTRFTGLLFLALGLPVSYTAEAAQSSPGDGVRVENVQISQDDANIIVSFTANVGKKAVKSDYELTITPFLVKGANQADLAPIVIRGKRARLQRNRDVNFSNYVPNPNAHVFPAGEQTIKYEAKVPMQPWMQGSDLYYQVISRGCCKEIPGGNEALTKDLFIELPGDTVIEVTDLTEEPPVAPVDTVRPVTAPTYITEEPVVQQVQPIQQVQTQPVPQEYFQNYPFLQPVDPSMPYDPRVPQQYGYGYGQYGYPTAPGYGGGLCAPPPACPCTNEAMQQNLICNRGASVITLFFHQGKTNLDWGFRNNSYNFDRLVSGIRAIQSIPNVRIVKILIAGFASPEGSEKLNHYLAGARANAAKDALSMCVGVPACLIETYNGGEDWKGLEILVENSNIPDKYEALNIIRNTPVWDARRKIGRETRLMRLNGGRAYKYMYNNMFPELRNATYIKVFYEVVKPGETVQYYGQPSNYRPGAQYQYQQYPAQYQQYPAQQQQYPATQQQYPVQGQYYPQGQYPSR